MSRSVTEGPTEQAGQWHPSQWIRALVKPARAQFPVTRSIRSAIAIGGPILGGVLTGHSLIGMWVAMGTLLLSAGEKDTSYRERFRQIAVVSAAACAGFLLGLLSEVPPLVTVLTMAVVAFGCGVVSGYSSLLSVATMQAMLIAALAIGLPVSRPYWHSALLFGAGAGLYTALLGIEAAFNRHQPDRNALRKVLDALADLAQHQADSGTDLASGRRRVLTALDEYDRLAIGRRRHGQGPTRSFDTAAAASRAVDQLVARLLAEDAMSDRSRAAADRLRLLAEAVGAGRSLDPLPDDGTLPRVHALEAAIRGETVGAEHPSSARRRLAPPGRELLMTATRLAVVNGIAYAVFLMTPIPRGYWIALTVTLVMKPDLGSVFGRAVTRSLGTIGGALIALVLGLVLPGDLLLGGALVVLAGLMPWASARSYAAKAVVMTPMVMLMINMVAVTESVPTLTGVRVVATVIGGVIVIVFGYLVWPSARHPDIATQFGAALTALAAYARAVAGDSAAADVTDRRRVAYRRLSDVNVSLQRCLAEPPPAGAEASAWLPVVNAAERVADRITDISARLETSDAPPEAETLDALAAEVERSIPRHGGVGGDQREVPVIRHGEQSNDPAVRALADAIAALLGMLSIPGSGRRPNS